MRRSRSSARFGAELERTMDNEELLEFYQYSIFKKLIDMQPQARAAFMTDLFGKRWIEVHDRLTNLYPQLLNVPNAGVKR